MSDSAEPTQTSAPSTTSANATDSTATDSTATDSTATDSTASDSTASDGTSSDSTSSDGTTSDGTTSDGTTSDGTTSDGTTSDGTTSDGTTGGVLEPFFPPCDALAIGEPITFEDTTPPTTRRTPATLAWDGQDLVVVRDDRDDNSCEVVFERRSPDGELLGTAVRSPSNGDCQFNASLGYNPSIDRYLYTNQVNGLRVGLIALDGDGTVLWEKSGWEMCNTLTATIDVAPRGEDFVVMGEQHACSSTPRHVVAGIYTADGVQEKFLQTVKTTAEAGDAACNLPSCERLITIRFGIEDQGTGTYAQMGDLETGELSNTKFKMNSSNAAGWDASGAVWNGEDWLILRIEDIGLSHKGHLRRWDEVLGWTSNDVTFASGGSPAEVELLWTGNDYVITYAEWPDNNKGLPDDWFELDLHYLLVGVDGTVKQHEVLERSSGYGGHSPQLVALPGAIGLSWVRVATQGNQNAYSRHFSRIECAS